MNIYEMDLNSEENKKKLNAAFQQMKTKIQVEERKASEEEQKRIEFEEKCHSLNNQKTLLDQKLAKTELAFKRKCEELVEKEEKYNELQRKLDFFNMNEPKKGFFNFGSDENKLFRKKLFDFQQEIEIKTNELQRLHELLFDTKKSHDETEKHYQEQISNLECKIQMQIETTEKEKKLKQELEKQVQQLNQSIINKEQELKVCKQQLNEQDDEIRQLKEQLQQQQQLYNELQITLIHKKEELKKNYQETDQLKVTLASIKENLFNIIPQLENESQNSQIVLGLKQFVDKTFGIDKQRDQKVNQIKQEQELQKELLVQKDSYQVFQKAKDRIIKMGKNMEQLEKKNKMLQDRIYILENKRVQGKGSEFLSDKISVM
ncbi:unnamed protein product [Paramecium primaurelia]|uniref:Uncharacterized protein n=1 Tax=Paramecium primaurelia TaxID=5886 RepID=A0A8S1JW39_PARPR|nr:unnamed protein product [Paramecium primaurelia]